MVNQGLPCSLPIFPTIHTPKEIEYVVRFFKIKIDVIVYLKILLKEWPNETHSSLFLQLRQQELLILPVAPISNLPSQKK